MLFLDERLMEVGTFLLSGTLGQTQSGAFGNKESASSGISQVEAQGDDQESFATGEAAAIGDTQGTADSGALLQVEDKSGIKSTEGQ